MRSAVFSLLAGAGLVSAHFKVDYPEWRGDTLAENTTYSQWNWPCGGVSYGAGNSTDWPLEGGSLAVELHHPWTYLYVNLGLGENATNFNISLTPELVNVTGKGTFCIPTLQLPSDAEIKDGLKASLQVVTSGDAGNALYNCADITFRSSAKALSGDACTNTTGVSAVVVSQASTTDPSATPTPTDSGASAMVLGGVPAILLGAAVLFAL
ncbi:hypothetical protein F4808DRAFT_417114 [Astrocystis sublimbata]|nr:hypothetical protein F4808DRAFT_417114 [Astrocystis sublimbata]